MIAVDATKANRSIVAMQKRLTKMARELGRSWTATISLPENEERKLTWFNDGTSRQPARPVFRIPKTVRDQIIADVQARFAESMLRGQEPQMLPVIMVAATAFRRVWVRRLERNGDDTPWAALAPRYAAWKARKRLDPRIGVATGAMLAAVRKGQIIVRKS